MDLGLAVSSPIAEARAPLILGGTDLRPKMYAPCGCASSRESTSPHLIRGREPQESM
jgi:hypothetical protein